MYAIIDDGGRQQRVTTGQTVLIDRAVGEDEKTVTFDRVLMVGGEGDAKVGAPLVGGATVVADVLGPVKGEKVINLKYRRRKRYHRKVGHRQQYTEVRITAINV